MREWKISGSEERLADALTQKTKLPLETVLQLLENGAVTFKARGKGSWRRVRDGSLQLHKLDLLQVCFDHRVLKIPAFVSAGPVWECAQYGVWSKPVGVMSQGTSAGDQASLLYAVEKFGRTPFLVHRLDRETEGIMLVAYDGKAAGVLSQMFQERLIHKTYHAIIVTSDHLPPAGTFTQELDGKDAQTEYRILQALPDNRSLAELNPVTGRLHQIRRHLALNGSGVWGDPQYGISNKNREGMKLAAVGIDFIDPWGKKSRSFKALASFDPSLAG